MDLGKRYIALYNFDASLSDELSFSVNDHITLVESFSDGWGACRNITTGDFGMLPLSFLEIDETREKDDILINSYLTAIDNKDKNKVEILSNENKKHNIKKDIVYEMYNENKLDSERFQFILENCTAYLNISSSLIGKLMKYNNIKLLELFFKKFNFFDNDGIIDLLSFYKSKKPMSNSELCHIINKDKYKILTENDKKTYFREFFDCFYYLIDKCKGRDEKTKVNILLEYGAKNIINNEKNKEQILLRVCKIGNLSFVKYLVNCKFDINCHNTRGETPLYFACKNGRIALVKYLVNNGADINKECKDGTTPISIACKEGHNDIVKYLMEKGAKSK